MLFDEAGLRSQLRVLRVGSRQELASRAAPALERKHSLRTIGKMTTQTVISVQCRVIIFVHLHTLRSTSRVLDQSTDAWTVPQPASTVTFVTHTASPHHAYEGAAASPASAAAIVVQKLLAKKEPHSSVSPGAIN